jgi:hypothetical protein
MRKGEEIRKEGRKKGKKVVGRKYKIIIERKRKWSRRRTMVVVEIGHEGGRMLPTESLRIMRVWAIVVGLLRGSRNAH